jgi:hypothetical protein
LAKDKLPERICRKIDNGEELAWYDWVDPVGAAAIVVGIALVVWGLLYS